MQHHMNDADVSTYKIMVVRENNVSTLSNKSYLLLGGIKSLIKGDLFPNELISLVECVLPDECWVSHSGATAQLDHSLCLHAVTADVVSR